MESPFTFPEPYKRLLSRKYPAIADYLILAVAFAVSLVWMGCFAGNVLSTVSGRAMIEVHLEDRLLYRSEFNPTVRKVLNVSTPKFILRIEESSQGVRILPIDKDNCPLGICSKLGWISKPGEALFCIPNRLSVSIAGRVPGSSEVDAVAR